MHYHFTEGEQRGPPWGRGEGREGRGPQGRHRAPEGELESLPVLWLEALPVALRVQGKPQILAPGALCCWVPAGASGGWTARPAGPGQRARGRPARVSWDCSLTSFYIQGTQGSPRGELQAQATWHAPNHAFSVLPPLDPRTGCCLGLTGDQRNEFGST